MNVSVHMVVAWACALGWYATPGCASGFEPAAPSVTRREADLLGRVASVAETNLPQAVSEIEAARRDDSSAALDFTLGNLWFRAGKLDQAAAAYGAALRKWPRFGLARQNLGRVFLVGNRGPEAEAQFREAMRAGEAGAETVTLLGHSLMLQGFAWSAENAYRQALFAEPSKEDALVGLCKALLRQERHAEGLAALREALERQPARTELWHLRAGAQLAMGKSRDALISLETARRLGLCDAETLARLGDLHMNEDQPEEAAARYRDAFATGHPSFDRLVRAVESFVAAGRPEEARTLMQRVRAPSAGAPPAISSDHDRRLLRAEAELARSAGDANGARAAYERLIGKDPLDARALMALGDLHRDAGRMEDAMLAYERAARVRGFEAAALARQAQIEVGRGRYPQAVRLLETAQVFRADPDIGRYLDQVRRLAR